MEKTILIHLLMLFIFNNSFSSEPASYDTIQHTAGGCITKEFTEKDEEFNFSFRNDTMIMSGKIIANACGSHFLSHAVNYYNALIHQLFFLKLDTGQVCQDYCLYHFEVKIPNCKRNQYSIRLEGYSSFGDYHVSLDTIIDKREYITYDTIQHITGSCINEPGWSGNEEFNFKFNGDTMVFYGQIMNYASFGQADYFLVYDKDSNNISFFDELATGSLYRSRCLFNFEVKIPDCTLDKYRIRLYNGLDTTISKVLNYRPVNFDNTFTIYPNPTTGKVRITPNNNIHSLEIFTIQGELIKKVINGFENIRVKDSGIYIFRINSNKHSIVYKVVKN